MRDFYFHTPNTLDEALTLLEEHQDDGRPMAGGTALVVLMKQSLLDADHLISLAKVPGLSGIRLEADGLHIGALTHHREVEMSDVVRQFAPLLADVYHHVATVRIRNVATVGGGLALSFAPNLARVQKLQAILARRDEITANLAEANPAVKEKFAQM